MSTHNITSDDPRLTAHALGELAGDDLAVIEAALRDDPELAAEFAAIQDMVGALEHELAPAESASLSEAARQSIHQAAQPKRRLRLVPLLGGSLIAASVMVMIMSNRFLEEPVPVTTAHIEQSPAPGPAARWAQDADGFAYAVPPAHTAEALDTPVVTELPVQVEEVSTEDAPAEVAGSIREPAVAQTEGNFSFGGHVTSKDAVPTDGLTNGRAQPWAGQDGGGVYPPSEPPARQLEQVPMIMDADPSLDHEGYAALGTNDFTATREEGGDASTFSIDVDTASYTNLRRIMLREGRLPRKEAVRIEEMVNYFRYAYAQPSEGNGPFTVAAETTSSPWNPQHRLVRIGIQGEDITREERPPSNLVFLIDTSGSMQSADKLDLLVKGFQHLVANLDARDRVSIVTYAGSAGLVLNGASGENKNVINGSLSRLRAGGSTNGGAGLALAYQTARQHFIDGGTNRVILATDGDFNVGTTSAGSLVDTVKAEAQGGIQMTVLGFGTGNLQDGRMEQISNDADGVYHYIDSLRESQRIFGEGLTGTLVTIARDVKIQVFFNPEQVAGWRLVGYQNRRLARKDFNDDTKDAGEIGAGHQVTALYEIIPAGKIVPGHVNSDPNPFVGESDIILEDKLPNPNLMRIRLRHKLPGEDQSSLQEFDLTDSGKTWEQASVDTRWASAVAATGMHLRQDKAVAEWSWSAIRASAAAALGSDPRGDRSEFLRIIDTATRLLPTPTPAERQDLPEHERGDNELKPVK